MSKPSNVYVLDTSAWMILIEDEAGTDPEIALQVGDQEVISVARGLHM